jgi:hypothetical protein
MYDLLKWEPGVQSSDYIKAPKVIRNKLQKADSPWLSETRDNFRRYIYSKEHGRLYFSNNPYFNLCFLQIE